MIVVNMNSCKCGFFADSTRECRCTPAQIQHYLGKISGPLLDRIDIHAEVPAVPYKEPRGEQASEPSAAIRARVERARAVQDARGQDNARMPSNQIRRLCVLDDAGERTLEMAVRRMGLSARAHDRILKVARTIADLDSAERVSAQARRRGSALPQPGSQLLDVSQWRLVARSTHRQPGRVATGAMAQLRSMVPPASSGTEQPQPNG